MNASRVVLTTLVLSLLSCRQANSYQRGYSSYGLVSQPYQPFGHPMYDSFNSGPYYQPQSRFEMPDLPENCPYHQDRLPPSYSRDPIVNGNQDGGYGYNIHPNNYNPSFSTYNDNPYPYYNPHYNSNQQYYQHFPNKQFQRPPLGYNLQQQQPQYNSPAVVSDLEISDHHPQPPQENLQPFESVSPENPAPYVLPAPTEELEKEPIPVAESMPVNENDFFETQEFIRKNGNDLETIYIGAQDQITDSKKTSNKYSRSAQNAVGAMAVEGQGLVYGHNMEQIMDTREHASNTAIITRNFFSGLKPTQSRKPLSTVNEMGKLVFWPFATVSKKPREQESAKTMSTSKTNEEEIIIPHKEQEHLSVTNQLSDLTEQTEFSAESKVDDAIMHKSKNYQVTNVINDHHDDATNNKPTEILKAMNDNTLVDYNSNYPLKLENITSNAQLDLVEDLNSYNSCLMKLDTAIRNKANQNSNEASQCVIAADARLQAATELTRKSLTDKFAVAKETHEINGMQLNMCAQSQFQLCSEERQQLDNGTVQFVEASNQGLAALSAAEYDHANEVQACLSRAKNTHEALRQESSSDVGACRDQENLI